MNQAVGTRPEPNLSKTAVDGPWLTGGNTAANGPYMTYAKLSSMTKPSPSRLFILLDENENSINDAGFGVRMSNPQWVDYPGTYHNRACGFAFGDSHSEIHKWLDRPDWVKYAESNKNPAAGRASDGPDWAWLAQRSSALR